jgi:hypothetical protein
MLYRCIPCAVDMLYCKYIIIDFYRYVLFDVKMLFSSLSTDVLFLALRTHKYTVWAECRVLVTLEQVLRTLTTGFWTGKRKPVIIAAWKEKRIKSLESKNREVNIQLQNNNLLLLVFAVMQKTSLRDSQLGLPISETCPGYLYEFTGVLTDTRIGCVSLSHFSSKHVFFR